MPPLSALRRFGAISLVGLTALMTIAGCVDNRENAIQFCGAQAELIAEARDGEELTSDKASDIANDLESNMRDAEDATRPVRRAARDVVDAYTELTDLLGDDEAEADELSEAADELQTARSDLREACAEVTET